MFSEQPTRHNKVFQICICSHSQLKVGPGLFKHFVSHAIKMFSLENSHKIFILSLKCPCISFASLANIYHYHYIVRYSVSGFERSYQTTCRCFISIVSPVASFHPSSPQSILGRSFLGWRWKHVLGMHLDTNSQHHTPSALFSISAQRRRSSNSRQAYYLSFESCR